ncbi:MAG: hypothetical protein NTY67_10280 [Cyanobacteria bacterium]|nr:hypothetical protein [Cyanobacteriota bacterium]
MLLRFFDQMMHFMALLLWIAGGLAFWQSLKTPNRLLWLGLLSEPLVAGCLVLAADTAHKSWLGSRPATSPQ